MVKWYLVLHCVQHAMCPRVYSQRDGIENAAIDR